MNGKVIAVLVGITLTAAFGLLIGRWAAATAAGMKKQQDEERAALEAL
jgi:hypothetical protein